MNLKRFVIAIVVIYILAFLAGFLIHGQILIGEYAQFPAVYRPDTEVSLLWINIGYLAFAIGAVWIYAKGVEDRPWLGQGLRFGLALWLVLAVPSFTISYAVHPISLSLTSKAIGLELINKLILGVVMAAIYRK